MRLFEIGYLAGGRGCPEFVSGTLTPSPPWEPFSRGAHLLVSDLGLEFRSKHRVLPDYFTWGVHYLVSCRLAELLHRLGVPARDAPVAVQYPNGAVDEAAYSVFVPADHRSVLDLDRSTYVTDTSGSTGEALTHGPDFPHVPNCARIHHFVVDPVVANRATVFYCVDIGALVCSQAVADEVVAARFRGIRLTPIDEDYRYQKYGMPDD